MTGRPATVLPVATLQRALPMLILLIGPSAQTAHIGEDRAGRTVPSCGRPRPRAAQSLDLAVDEAPALRVCTGCARTLTDLTRTHLATLGRPTPGELAAVHEARIRAVASACAAELERIREDAIFDGSVSETVHLVEAKPKERAPDHRRETPTFGGHTAVATALTVGQLAGALKPGASTGGRVWITDAPEPGTAVHVPGSMDGTLVCAPAAPGRFPVYTWPQVQKRLAGYGR